MILLCTLALMALFTLVDILFSKQLFWLKNICFGMFGYFTSFVMASGTLFAVDAYSLWAAYGICFGVGVVAAGVCWWKLRGDKEKRLLRGLSRNDATRDGAGRNWWLCLAGLLVLGMIVSFSKFEFFGMGQDQGVYHTAAMFRMAGYNDLQIDLDGYHALEDEGDRALYRAAVDSVRTAGPNGNLQGFYSSQYNNRLYEPLSEVSGYIHGIPTYAALLSVFGLIFGFSGMWHFQTLFLLVSVCLIFLCLSRNLTLKLSTSVVFTALFALSPIVIWTTKSSLAESSITFIMAMFIYLITSKEDYANKLLWLPIAAFSFIHLTVYTMMPMFVVLFLVLYIQRRDRNIVISGVVSLAMYLWGFFMMFYTSNEYTLSGYNVLKKISDFIRFDHEGLATFVSIITLAAIAMMVALPFFIRRFDIKLNQQAFLVFCKYAMLVCVAYIIYKSSQDYVWHFLYATERDLGSLLLVSRALISSTSTVTLISFAFLSGFIVVPIVLFGIFMRRSVFAENDIVPIVAAFMYCIVFYSTLIRRETSQYYYFARYLAAFIPVILVMGAIYIDGFKLRTRAIVSCASIALTLPFSLFLVIYKDDTKMDWDAFEQAIAVVDELSEDDVVIVPNESLRYFFLPLNALTDSIILPNADYKFVADKLENPGSGRVFYLAASDNYIQTTSLPIVAWSSEYPTVPGLLPPLPLSVEYDDYIIHFSEVHR